MSDHVKEVRCTNSNSDAKMEYLVSEFVSKQRFIFFTAFAPANNNINELIFNITMRALPSLLQREVPQQRTLNTTPKAGFGHLFLHHLLEANMTQL